MKKIAMVGGLGYSPIAPGTLGSLVGLGVAWVLRESLAAHVIGCFVVTALGFLSAGPAARAMGQEDPPAIVIDEVAGMMVGLLFVQAHLLSYGIAFLLFRFFDIVKPPPIRQIQRLPGSWGIMLDDLLAGLCANLSVHACIYILRYVRV